MCASGRLLVPRSSARLDPTEDRVSRGRLASIRVHQRYLLGPMRLRPIDPPEPAPPPPEVPLPGPPDGPAPEPGPEEPPPPPVGGAPGGRGNGVGPRTATAMTFSPCTPAWMGADSPSVASGLMAAACATAALQAPPSTSSPATKNVFIMGHSFGIGAFLHSCILSLSHIGSGAFFALGRTPPVAIATSPRSSFRGRERSLPECGAERGPCSTDKNVLPRKAAGRQATIDLSRVSFISDLSYNDWTRISVSGLRFLD